MKRAVAALLGCLFSLPVAARADNPCYANFMFVLDRSCSMNKPLDKGGTTTKWVYASDAINKLVAAGAGQASFGLTFFPTPVDPAVDMAKPACEATGVGPIAVPIAADSASAISTALTKDAPGAPCTTPIVPGITQAGTDPSLAAPYASGPRTYAILITDGEPTCGETASDVSDAIATLYQRGYPTFVVGFGGAVNPTILDEAAVAGGVPRTSFVDDAGQPYDAGGLSYYQADDAQSLDDVLQSILGQIVGEFSTCVGTPCPDGRCFGANETCESGFCYTTTDMAGSGSLDASANLDAGSSSDAGGAGSKKNGGCGCDIGGRPATTPIALALAIGAWFVLRRRRA